MDDLDFVGKSPTPPPPPRPQAAPQPDILYSRDAALAFFAGGTRETVPAGKRIFAESEKSGGLFSKGERVYLLVEGEVDLSANGASVGRIRAGEVFGEMAALAGVPRSASAVAKADCRLLALEERQFQAALAKSPEFALMLMGLMVARMREALGRSVAGGYAGGEAGSKTPARREPAFDRRLLAELRQRFADRAPLATQAGKVVLSAGAAGTLMYVVLEGRVGIVLGGRLLELVGPGGVFGEMALVDRSPRSASAVADVDSTLLPLNRPDFLSLVKTDPRFGAALLRAIAARASGASR